MKIEGNGTFFGKTNYFGNGVFNFFYPREAARLEAQAEADKRALEAQKQRDALEAQTSKEMTALANKQALIDAMLNKGKTGDSSGGSSISTLLFVGILAVAAFFMFKKKK